MLAQQPCPAPPLPPYYLQSDDSIHLNFRARTAGAVAQANIVLADSARVDGPVYGGASILVDFFVRVAQRFIFAVDSTDVEFEEEMKPIAQVCAVPAPLACASTPCTGLPFCSGTTCAARPVSSAGDDLVVHQDTVVEIGARQRFGRLSVQRRARLVLTEPGVYHFSDVEVWEDAVIELRPAPAQGRQACFELRVGGNIDLEERVRIVGGDTYPLLLYQGSDTGRVHIDNAPANNDHALHVNIVSQGTRDSGGYVYIGYRQTIYGFIASKSDITLEADVRQFKPLLATCTGGSL